LDPLPPPEWFQNRSKIDFWPAKNDAEIKLEIDIDFLIDLGCDFE
jgi:hypothetical protein